MLAGGVWHSANSFHDITSRPFQQPIGSSEVNFGLSRHRYNTRRGKRHNAHKTCCDGSPGRMNRMKMAM
eukprot:5804040-Pleurochrysis_carterae.AAC.1